MSNSSLIIKGPQGDQGNRGPAGADGQVTSIVAGTNISVDSTNPGHPIVSATTSGTGNVVGPASAVDNAITRYDGTTGKLVQGSTETTISDTGVLHLGPAETEDPYASARFKFADNTGNLSDAAFTAYGGGYSVIALASASATASAPADTVAAATLGMMRFRGRYSGVWKDASWIKATDDSLTLPSGARRGQVTIGVTGDVTGTPFAFYHNSTSNIANAIAFSSSSTGNQPFIAPYGTDTNIGLNLVPKGTGTVQVNGSDIATTTGSQTITNKRINSRVTSVTSAATHTPDVSTTDNYVITAQAVAATFAAPIGTPVAGQKLLIRIKDNGTVRTLTWNTIFRAIGVALPSTTVANKTMYVGSIYNATDTRWDVIGVSQEA